MIIQFADYEINDEHGACEGRRGNAQDINNNDTTKSAEPISRSHLDP